MPSANVGIDLVRLASSPQAFTILGRFPAGFERLEPGGYDVAEELLVLRGALELQGTVAERGVLCFLPAGLQRAPMRTREGCTVLAWFGGPALFRPAAEMAAGSQAGMVAVQTLTERVSSPVLCTDEATWEIVDARDLGQPSYEFDAVDLEMTIWARVAPGARPSMPSGPLLTRVPATAARAGVG